LRDSVFREIKQKNEGGKKREGTKNLKEEIPLGGRKSRGGGRIRKISNMVPKSEVEGSNSGNKKFQNS